MLMELAKPAALLLSILSLCVLFHTAFLVQGDFNFPIPSPALHDRILNSLLMLALSAAICTVSGLLFRDAESQPHPSLSATLPIRLFYWAISIMLLLFVISWYLETHCVFYRSTARW